MCACHVADLLQGRAGMDTSMQGATLHSVIRAPLRSAGHGKGYLSTNENIGASNEGGILPCASFPRQPTETQMLVVTCQTWGGQWLTSGHEIHLS